MFLKCFNQIRFYNILKCFNQIRFYNILKTRYMRWYFKLMYIDSTCTEKNLKKKITRRI